MIAGVGFGSSKIDSSFSSSTTWLEFGCDEGWSGTSSALMTVRGWRLGWVEVGLALEGCLLGELLTEFSNLTLLTYLLGEVFFDFHTDGVVIFFVIDRL